MEAHTICRYNNLMFLKTYDGSAEDLCLSFTIANDDFGTNKEIELIPNGANIDVTDFNKHRYIGKLNHEQMFYLPFHISYLVFLWFEFTKVLLQSITFVTESKNNLKHSPVAFGTSSIETGSEFSMNLNSKYSSVAHLTEK